MHRVSVRVLEAQVTAATRPCFNPFSGNFQFTDPREWIDALGADVKRAFPEADIHWVSNRLRDRHDDTFTFKDADWYMHKVYVEPGGSEGYLLTYEVEHRTTMTKRGPFPSQKMLVIKFLSGMEDAIAACGHLTRCIHAWGTSVG